MPAQGEPRDECHVIEGWCASHQAPVGHNATDPADRPSAGDAEEQYAGTLPGEVAASEHNRRAATAVLEQDTAELSRLRAEAAAVGALRNADQVFLIQGRCLLCDSTVHRQVRYEGPYATLARWAHDEDGKDEQHLVTNVLPPSGTV